MVKRVYGVDAFVCPRCGGEMRVIAFNIDLQLDPMRPCTGTLEARDQLGFVSTLPIRLQAGQQGIPVLGLAGVILLALPLAHA